MKQSPRLLAALLAVWMLVLLLPSFTPAQADGEVRAYADTVWSIQQTKFTTQTGRWGTQYTVTRSVSNADCEETVYYRTISLTAVEGQHFTKTTGSLTFGEGITSQSVNVYETIPSTEIYKYQIGSSRKYRFEVADAGGFQLAYADHSVTADLVSVADDALMRKSITVDAGPFDVTDKGFSQMYKAVPLDDYWHLAPREFLSAVGVEDLDVSFTFEAKEINDGYQYLQIYVNDTTSVDYNNKADKGDPKGCKKAPMRRALSMIPAIRTPITRNTSFRWDRLPTGEARQTPGTISTTISAY